MCHFAFLLASCRTSSSSVALQRRVATAYFRRRELLGPPAVAVLEKILLADRGARKPAPSHSLRQRWCSARFYLVLVCTVRGFNVITWLSASPFMTMYDVCFCLANFSGPTSYSHCLYHSLPRHTKSPQQSLSLSKQGCQAAIHYVSGTLGTQ